MSLGKMLMSGHYLLGQVPPYAFSKSFRHRLNVAMT